MSEIFEIKADIEHTREELAAAVDSLTARLDVKAMLHRRVEQLRGAISDEETRLRVAAAGGGVLLLLIVRRRRRRRRERRHRE